MCNLLYAFLIVGLLFTVDASVIAKPDFEDPGHDGYIIDGFLNNAKDLILRYDLSIIPLPDFDFLPESFWGVRGRDGSFGNLGRISRVNISTLTVFDDGVTNLDALLYVPNAKLQYRLSAFDGFGMDLGIWFFINAARFNFNYTTETPCSIEYNTNSVDVLVIQESVVNIYVDILHSWLIPHFLADFVEKFLMATVAQIFVDYQLLKIVRETLNEYILSILVEYTEKIDACQIFVGPTKLV